MMLTVARMQTILVEADTATPATGYTAEELAFRERSEVELADIHARGSVLGFDPGESDLGWD